MRLRDTHPRRSRRGAACGALWNAVSRERKSHRGLQFNAAQHQVAKITGQNSSPRKCSHAAPSLRLRAFGPDGCRSPHDPPTLPRRGSPCHLCSPAEAAGAGPSSIPSRPAGRGRRCAGTALRPLGRAAAVPPRRLERGSASRRRQADVAADGVDRPARLHRAPVSDQLDRVRLGEIRRLSPLAARPRRAGRTARGVGPNSFGVAVRRGGAGSAAAQGVERVGGVRRRGRGDIPPKLIEALRHGEEADWDTDLADSGPARVNRTGPGRTGGRGSLREPPWPAEARPPPA